MANKIVLKKSSVAAKVPLAADLEVGEIAVNLVDQKLYSKNAGGTVIVVGQGSGVGDVVGPASATDNALARFDGTTGKLIQNSVATLTDAGAMDVPNITVDYTQYDTAATVTSAVGRMNWDSGNGSLSLGLKNGNVDLKLGEQEYVFSYNDTGVALTKGQVVYINGAQGNRVSVLLAIATGDLTSGTTIGLVAESIAIGAEGWVQISGPLYKLNTLGLTAGAPIYLSSTVAGGYTTTKPVAPDHLVTLGFVSRVDNIVGSVFIKVDNGYELDELHNVLITTPISGNTLIYDAVAQVWENANLTAGAGVSVTNGAGSITIANTGVRSLTGTANEIDVSASTGAVTLSLPVTINANTTGSAATLTTGRTIAITGDIAYTSPSFNGSANVTAAGTLATVNANVGSFTNASVTVNAKGLVTAASSGTAPVTSVTGTSPVVSSGGATPAISLSAAYGDTLNPYASKTANTVLAAPTGVAGVPTFRAIVAADIPTLNQNTTGTAANVTGTVAIANGGTSATTAAAALTALGAYPSTNPNGYTNNTGTVTSVSALTLGATGTDLSSTVATGTTTPVITLQVPTASATNRGALSSTDWTTFNNKTSNTGTVTSVGGTGTVSGISLSGTVTTSGNLTLGGTLAVTASNFASQTANTFLAAPTGIAGVPTFRTVVAADIPTLNQNTTGTAANVTGTVAIANGGTGATTRQAAMDALAGATTSGQYLRGNGTDVVMAAIVAADVPTLNQNTTGTAANVTGTVAVANGGTGATSLAANNVILGNNGGAVQVVAPGTSGNVLTSNGTTWTSAAAGGGSFTGARGQVFTTTGTFTVPTGVTAVKVTVVGGGGNGGAATGVYAGAGGGGGGGVAIQYVTGLTPGGTVTATVGGVAGTSSFGAFCSATGGATAPNGTAGFSVGGAGGVGSSGNINMTGGKGGNGQPGSCSGSGRGGSGGGSSGAIAWFDAIPGVGIFGGLGGFGGVASAGFAATGYGNGGGGGGADNNTDRAAGAGSGGIIVVEW